MKEQLFCAWCSSQRRRMLNTYRLRFLDKRCMRTASGKELHHLLMFSVLMLQFTPRCRRHSTSIFIPIKEEEARRAASADQELEVPALAVNQASAHSHLVASQAKASDSSLLSTNQVRAKSQYNHTAMWLLDNLSPASHSSLKINQTTTSSMGRSSHPQPAVRPAVTSMTSKPGLTL